MTERIPVPSLVVLVGASGSGKSRWAAETFGGRSVVSSDALRAVVGESEQDQAASSVAFELLERAVQARLARSLTTVIDTTGLREDDRHRWRDAGRAAGMPTVLVVFDVPGAVCHQRNRRRDRRVPVAVIDDQVRELRTQRASLDAEGWDRVVIVDERAVPAATATASMVAAAPTTRPDDGRSLRIGLHLSRVDTGDGADVGVLASGAEQAGVASLWMMDHLVQIPQVGRRWDDIVDPFVGLSFAAASTERVTVGPLVAGIAHRPVPNLAKAMATLDVLSGGRAVCGVGAGWFVDENLALGRDFPSLVARFDLLADGLELLRRLWGPGTKPYEGRVLRASETTCYPRPVRGTIPILVGGQGERRTLRLAAEHADAVNLFGEPDVVEAKLAVLRAHCDDVGRDPDEIRVTHLSTVLTGLDDSDVAGLVDAHGPRTGTDRWRARVHAGTVDDQIARFRRLAAVGVDEAILAFPYSPGPADIDRLEPVIGAFE